jgi:hypothetical protein
MAKWSPALGFAQTIIGGAVVETPRLQPYRVATGKKRLFLATGRGRGQSSNAEPMTPFCTATTSSGDAVMEVVTVVSIPQSSLLGTSQISQRCLTMTSTSNEPTRSLIASSHPLSVSFHPKLNPHSGSRHRTLRSCHWCHHSEWQAAAVSRTPSRSHWNRFDLSLPISQQSRFVIDRQGETPCGN